MVSGGYKGASVNVNDWIVVGLLGVAAYFVYKTVIKPTSAITGAAGETGGIILKESGESWKAVSDFFQQGWGYLTSQIGSKGETATTKQISEDKPSIYSSFKSDGKIIPDYVTSVSSAGVAFDKVPLQNIRFASGKSTTIATAPNTFYKDLGIGFTSKGQGYSAYQPLKI